MLKTISATLIAASVLAAPAFAASTRTADAPVIKSTQVKTDQVKTTAPKASVLNANAMIGPLPPSFLVCGTISKFALLPAAAVTLVPKPLMLANGVYLVGDWRCSTT